MQWGGKLTITEMTRKYVLIKDFVLGNCSATLENMEKEDSCSMTMSYCHPCPSHIFPVSYPAEVSLGLPPRSPLPGQTFEHLPTLQRHMLSKEAYWGSEGESLPDV